MLVVRRINVAFDRDNGKRGRAKKTWNKKRKILLNYLSLFNKESERILPILRAFLFHISDDFGVSFFVKFSNSKISIARIFSGAPDFQASITFRPHHFGTFMSLP